MSIQQNQVCGAKEKCAVVKLLYSKTLAREGHVTIWVAVLDLDTLQSLHALAYFTWLLRKQAAIELTSRGQLAVILPESWATQ